MAAWLGVPRPGGAERGRVRPGAGGRI